MFHVLLVTYIVIGVSLPLFIVRQAHDGDDRVAVLMDPRLSRQSRIAAVTQGGSRMVSSHLHGILMIIDRNISQDFGHIGIGTGTGNSTGARAATFVPITGSLFTFSASGMRGCFPKGPKTNDRTLGP